MSIPITAATTFPPIVFAITVEPQDSSHSIKHPPHYYSHLALSQVMQFNTIALKHLPLQNSQKCLPIGGCNNEVPLYYY